LERKEANIFAIIACKSLVLISGRFFPRPNWNCPSKALQTKKDYGSLLLKLGVYAAPKGD
jgi:hypothetical protein